MKKIPYVTAISQNVIPIKKIKIFRKLIFSWLVLQNMGFLKAHSKKNHFFTLE